MYNDGKLCAGEAPGYLDSIIERADASLHPPSIEENSRQYLDSYVGSMLHEPKCLFGF